MNKTKLVTDLRMDKSLARMHVNSERQANPSYGTMNRLFKEFSKKVKKKFLKIVKEYGMKSVELWNQRYKANLGKKSQLGKLWKGYRKLMKEGSIGSHSVNRSKSVDPNENLLKLIL